MPLLHYARRATRDGGLAVRRLTRAHRRGLLAFSTRQSKPEEDRSKHQEDDAYADESRVKSTIAMTRNATPAKALPSACFVITEL